MAIEIDKGEKPWSGLRVESEISSYTDLITLVKQGIEKKDKDGKPISDEDADFMIAFGVICLRTETGWARRHPNTTNIGDPFFTNQANNLIEAKGKWANEYVKRLWGNEFSLPPAQSHLIGEAMRRKTLLNF